MLLPRAIYLRRRQRADGARNHSHVKNSTARMTPLSLGRFQPRCALSSHFIGGPQLVSTPLTGAFFFAELGYLLTGSHPVHFEPRPQPDQET
jgi:hypothetical protein